MPAATKKAIVVTMGDATDGTNGVCLKCGETEYGGVEPDARGYECSGCGARAVCGIEEAVIMGYVVVTDDDGDEDSMD